MRVEITKAAAAALLLPLAAIGKVKGGSYYRDREDPSAAIRVGHRCAIGWLYSEQEAEALERRRVYMLADDLIKDGMLAVDDPNWFVALQRAADADRDGSRGLVADMCREVLKQAKPVSQGYDIGNRRSDPVYA